MSAAIDSWWAELGEPDPYVVMEAGAGRGALAASVLGAGPRCAPALRYVMVERSEALRRRQHEHRRPALPIEPAALVLGPVAVASDDDDADRAPAATATGPLVTSLDELPAGKWTGVVLANELLDNVGFRLLERRGGQWSEVLVGADLDEVQVTAPPDLADEACRLAPDAPEGGRIPIQHEAAGWLRRSLAALDRGRVVVIDYADTTPSLARRPWTDWVRTYRNHGRGTHPLADPGSQDITCEVAGDQLARVHPPAQDRSQGEFLAAHGMEAMAATARRAWQERAHIGDLEALVARSRVGEASALGDPAGLGGFRVMEWVVG